MKTLIEPPGILTLKPFTPEKFDCTIWKGPANGEGLEGEEEQDKRSLFKTTFDPVIINEANFQTGSPETGEVKLARVIRDMIQADARFAQTLFEEERQKTLRFLRNTLGVVWLEFLGTVIRIPCGNRCAFYLDQQRDGSWEFSSYWLKGIRNAEDPALGFPG